MLKILTDEKLEYVGFAATTRAPAGGWHDINIWVPTFELTAWEAPTPRPRRTSRY